MRREPAVRCVGRGLFPNSHDERVRSFAPGRRQAAGDAGPRCAAAACARHAHRAVRRHLRSAACGAPRRLPAGDEAARPRPGLVAGHARQSAEGYAAAWRRSPTRVAAARRWRTIRASTSPISKPQLGTRLHLRDRVLPGAALPAACTSSGSWAPTICAASIAGSAGAASPHWCRSRSSIGWAEPLCHRRAPPARRWRAARLPEAAATKLAGTQAAGLDLSARPQIAAVVDGAARRAGVRTSLR